MAGSLFTPRMFLIVGGVVLLLLGVVGFLNIFTQAAYPQFFLTTGENVAHVGLGIIALAAVYVPGLNSALAPYYRWIVMLVGVIALFFAVYGLVVLNNPPLNTFGVANLEIVDSVIHFVVAAWAFAASLMTRPAMEMSRP